MIWGALCLELGLQVKHVLSYALMAIAENLTSGDMTLA